jgi:hypothetical protein
MSVRNTGLWVILLLLLLGNFSTLILTKVNLLLTLESTQELFDEGKSTPEIDFEIKKIFHIKGIKLYVDFSLSTLINNFKKIPFYYSDHIIPLFSPPPNH